MSFLENHPIIRLYVFERCEMNKSNNCFNLFEKYYIDENGLLYRSKSNNQIVPCPLFGTDRYVLSRLSHNFREFLQQYDACTKSYVFINELKKLYNSHESQLLLCDSLGHDTPKDISSDMLFVAELNEYFTNYDELVKYITSNNITTKLNIFKFEKCVTPTITLL